MKKKRLEEASQSKSTDKIVDPLSSIRRHLKWKMTHTKKSDQTTFEATKEVVYRIVSYFLCQWSFVIEIIGRKPNLFHLLNIEFPTGAGLTGKLCRPWMSGCTNYCHWATRAPWSCPCCCSRCHDQTILWTSFKKLPHVYVHDSQRPEAKKTQKIKDQLEESIIEKETRRLMLSFSQMKSQMQSQGLTLPPEPKVGASTAHVSTKGSCVNPSEQDPDMGDSEKYELCVNENPPCLVALERVYKGRQSSTMSLWKMIK